MGGCCSSQVDGDAGDRSGSHLLEDPPRQPSPDSTAKVAALELSLLHQDGGAHLTRRHEGKRVFGAKADLVKKISTSAGTAALAHVVLTQVEALGFVKDDAVVLRAEVEMAPTVRVL